MFQRNSYKRFMNFAACTLLIDSYSDNTDANYQSKSGLINSSIKKSEAIIGLKLFIARKSRDLAICRVFFVFFFFYIEKRDFLNR